MVDTFEKYDNWLKGRLELEYDLAQLKAEAKKKVSDEDIDNFYPIKSEHTTLTMMLIERNKARREGAKAHRDGLIPASGKAIKDKGKEDNPNENPIGYHHETGRNED